MNVKSCPFCKGKRCIKKGLQEGKQRWKCKDCTKKFQANTKAPFSQEELLCLYAFGKQTLKELSQEYHLKTKTIQRMCDEVILPEKIHEPRALALCVDATYFEDFAVVVFRDQKRKENLWWKIIPPQERCSHYQEGKEYLEKLGYTFLSVTADGLPGLSSVFQDIPFQYCHFHAKKNITKYNTKNPKTDAGIELKFIMENLSSYTPQSFLRELKSWSERHETFLKEKTFHPVSGRHSYTHRNLRSALKSLWKMSPLLFTYQKHPFFVPRTTNTLEGFFSHLKVRLGVHRGLSTVRKKRIVEIIVQNSTTQYTKGMHEELF